MGRLPDRRHLIGAILVLCLLPSLPGGGRDALSLPSRASHLPEGFSPLWVFFSEDVWEGGEALGTLKKAGARPRHRSEWLKGYSVEATPSQALVLAGLPGVDGIRWVAGLPAPARKPQQLPDTAYGGLFDDLEALGIPDAHSLGLSGSGVRVGILDGTFLDGHVTLRTRAPLATRDFVDQDSSPFFELSDPQGSASHGTALWSLISGDLPGTLRGGAPGVDILLARVRGFDEISQVDEDRWVAGLEWLESQGARIVLSGVGFRDFPTRSYTLDDLNGDVTPATRAADEAARRGVLVVVPVGNDGPGVSSLHAPADGDSVLAVGAVDSRRFPASFSALGPTGDGREKPDFFAPGLALEAASGVGPQALEQVSGTEFAAALLAGGFALAVEAHPDRGPMALLEMFRQSVPQENAGAVGLPNVAGSILFPDGLYTLPLQEVDNEGAVTNLAPLFQWTAPTIYPAGLPVTFKLEIAEDSLFQSLVQTGSVVGTFARRPVEPLPPREEIYWRIRGISTQGVERYTRVQGPVSVPSWVYLEVLNEPSGSELVNPQPEFRWSSPEVSAPAGPLLYELQVISDREEGEIIQSHPDLEETSFTLEEPLPFNLPMRWRVIALAPNQRVDTVTSSGPFVVTSGANPPATILYQNFPNPFPNLELGRRRTRIWFDLAETSTVELALFDIRGRLVRRLIPGRGCGPVELESGLYGREDVQETDPCVRFSWDGMDDRGEEVKPGVYLLRLRAGGVTNVRRVVYWP